MIVLLGWITLVSIFSAPTYRGQCIALQLRDPPKKIVRGTLPSNLN